MASADDGLGPERLVRLEQASGPARLVLARPDKRNAVNRAMYDQAVEQVNALEQQGVRVAVLSSAGPVFCAGADLGELAGGFNAPVALAERLMASQIFWIAEVSGGALGAGVALVSACHAALGTAETWFSLPELSRGFYPEPVIAWTAERGISRRWLHGLAVTCRRAAAVEAAANGLLSGVVGDDKPLDQAVDELVERIEAAQDSVEPLLRSWRGASGA